MKIAYTLVKLLSLFSLLSNLTIGYAKAEALPALQLTNLMQQGDITLKPQENKLLFLTFFENKCRWCLRQITTYNKVKNKVPANFIMVGVGDSKTVLRHWAKRAQPLIPVALASEDLIQLVGEPKVTPFTIIFDSKGRFVTKVTGYIKEEVLAELTSIVIE